MSMGLDLLYSCCISYENYKPEAVYSDCNLRLIYWGPSLALTNVLIELVPSIGRIDRRFHGVNSLRLSKIRILFAAVHR